MKPLLDYSWPGNVRELANVIEYAVTVAGRETILPEDLPEERKRPNMGRESIEAGPPPRLSLVRARNRTEHRLKTWKPQDSDPSWMRINGNGLRPHEHSVSAVRPFGGV
jgi:DNA-binding NtrC family response regulator